MKVYIRKIEGLKGFTRDMWAVYSNNGTLVKLLPTKSEAQQFAANINGRMK